MKRHLIANSLNSQWVWLLRAPRGCKHVSRQLASWWIFRETLCTSSAGPISASEVGSTSFPPWLWTYTWSSSSLRQSLPLPLPMSYSRLKKFHSHQSLLATRAFSFAFHAFLPSSWIISAHIRAFWKWYLEYQMSHLQSRSGTDVLDSAETRRPPHLL